MAYRQQWLSKAGILSAALLVAVLAAGEFPQFSWGKSRQSNVVVTIAFHNTLQKKILGMGVQWDPYDYYSPSPQDWNTIIQRLDFMDPSFIRDIGGGDSTDARILAWAQQHDSQVILGTWTPSPLSGTSPPSASAITSWASTTAQYVKSLNAQYGNVIHYYNFVNEPQNLPISTWTRLASGLQAAFTQASMGNSVRVIGPDTYGDPDWGATANKRRSYNWPLLQAIARRASGIVGAFDIHWYPYDKEVSGGSIRSVLAREKRLVVSVQARAAKLPFLVAEAGLLNGKTNGDQQPRVKTFGYGVLMADYATQVFRAGWDGISAWDLDDAMHVVNGKPMTQPPSKLTLKIWGFWNSQGAAMGDPADFDIRPWFYTWSLMSRMFPAGTRIVDSTEPAGTRRFRTLVGTRIVDDRLIISVVLVNDVKKSRNITVRVPPDAHARTLTEYSYFRHDRPVNAQGLPVAAKILHNVSPAHKVNIFMPSRGVVFLTNRHPFDTR